MQGNTCPYRLSVVVTLECPSRSYTSFACALCGRVSLVAMRALVWHGPAQLSIDELPEPEPGPRDVLIVREAAGICGSDLLMPDVDGFAVVEQLRADPVVDDVPIVVLTSKEITRADHERLAGQISYLAQKGTFPQADLVDLVGRVAAGGGREKT